MDITPGFTPKRSKSSRLPPGQYETTDFPVLSLGPTPDISVEDWKLKIDGLVENPLQWNWDEITALPKEQLVKDIHCVTKWSKFDSKWEGVSMDVILGMIKPTANATHVIAHSYDGYSTNLPIEDITDGKAWIATAYDSDPIEPDHGGPVRLFVPHLYFWKSAKWLSRLEFVDRDIPGFWETKGYHNYGNPWEEQRYTND